MSINAMGKNEIANNRKVLSDFKNSTDSLNFKEVKLVSSQGKAYKAVRELSDRKEMAELFDDCQDKYFNDLFNSLECEA